MANSPTASKTSNSRQREVRELRQQDVADMSQDLMQYFREYARENPEKTALWCLGIGFVLGWKLKPW
jgi:hypothetical protein